jgi:hypothetical protein
MQRVLTELTGSASDRWRKVAITKLKPQQICGAPAAP